VIQQKNVRELLFSPDGKYLVTKVEDIRRCSLHLWNLADEQEINRISQNYTLHSLVFSPDGEYLAAGSIEKITYVWKVKTGEEVARIKHQQYAHQVSFSPIFEYGKYLLATATDTAQVWQLDGSPKVMTFAHNAIENQTSHKGILFDAELSPDGKYLATAGEDKTVIVWEVITGKMVVTLHDSHPIKTVSFSPDGDYLVTATDFQSLIWEWKENTEEPLKCIEHSHCSIFSPDGKYIATASGNIVKIWDWVNDKVIRELSHQDQVTSLTFNTKTELIVAGSMKGITIVWEISTGRQVKQLLPYKTVN
jgi:WD40 repeat protein